MSTAYVLYNLKAGNNTKMDDIKVVEGTLCDNIKYIDVLQIDDYKEFINGLDEGDCIVLCGGDGTLNRYINNTDGIEYNNKVYHYPTGTGNDFATDMGFEKGCKPFEITEYIKELPYVMVNGRKSRFINGIGYGIDGYCCEVGDEIKKKSDKKVNYTNIAIKGLMFHYKPTNATVTVDGVTKKYKKVWLAPTMKGRYFGGGMMPTPKQNRSAEEKSISFMTFYGAGRMLALMLFPSLFKGEHIKHKKHVDIISGKNITVEFDRPVALQIDGETVLNVTKYTAQAV